MQNSALMLSDKIFWDNKNLASESRSQKKEVGKETWEVLRYWLKILMLFDI